MQIHAGNLKGRRIKTVKNAPYRPTTALVRKSLFDILGNIENNTFLDLFSGTGIIGFEAKSRGARHVTFVEKSLRAHALLKMNFSLLGMTNDNCVIKKVDAFQFIKQSQKFDIIFADPPYDFTIKQYLEMIELINANENLSDKGELVIEHSSNIKLSDYLKNIDERKYGSSVLSFIKKASL